MLTISVAIGVVCAFGTPFGGILFSIEVTQTYYMVNGLWKSYFSLTFTLVIFKLLRIMNLITTF